MASNFIGLNRGKLEEVPSSIATGSATQATDIELRIDTGKGTTRKDVKIALEAIINFVMSNGYGSSTNLPPF
jgi:hypothetical protein